MSIFKSLADRIRPREHDVIIDKINKLDQQQGEISDEIRHIRFDLDPLYTMIMEMRDPPHGWTKTREDR